MSAAEKPTLGIAMVGHGLMGRAHSHAWQNVAAIFDLPVAPVMVVLCGRDGAAVERERCRLRWKDGSTDWRAAIERPDVQVVDICTPSASHPEIALAALAAGKHVLCEKPLANSLTEAEAMAQGAAQALAVGARSMVGFNYRRVPAVGLARQIVAAGRLGEIRHVRAQYLQEWLVDPTFPLTWRLTHEEAGSGALGDLASHLVDLATHLLADEVTSVSSLLRTFVAERPSPTPRSDADAAARSSDVRGVVTVDDASLFLAQFSLGGVGSFEATRVAAGNKKAMRIEINGTAGSLRLNFERLNELELFEGADDENAGFRTILVTEPHHPWMSGWPSGHVIGWEHTFVHQARDLLTAIGNDHDVFPNFSDGLQTQRVLAAVETAHRSRQWEAV